MRRTEILEGRILAAILALGFLNNVFGARLRITSLRAAAGPGIEFLEYLAPRDGRATPADTRANDLVYWQTRLRTRDPDATFARLRSGHTGFISAGIVSLQDTHLGFRKGILVRDPDGHAVELVGE